MVDSCAVAVACEGGNTIDAGPWGPSIFPEGVPEKHWQKNALAAGGGAKKKIEVSQLDDHIFEILIQVLLELPQRPLVVFAGDLSQLQPVGSGGLIRSFLGNDDLMHIHMETHEFARSKDAVLLDFLSGARVRQPSKGAIREFFGSRHLGRDLPRAVAECRRISREAPPGDRDPATWLTCTNAGAQKVNYEYLRQCYDLDGATLESHPGAFRADPDYGVHKVVIQSGMWLRMTKNIDKDRGFCNGATGTVAFVLSDGISGPPVFIVRLIVRRRRRCSLSSFRCSIRNL